MEKLLEFKPFKALLKMIGECMDFKGRTACAEFWWAILGIVIIEFAVAIVFGILMAILPDILDTILSLILRLFTLACSFVGLSMDFRRLHDVNKPALWLLLGLVPLGFIVPLIFCTQPSHPEENQYGPVPTSIV